MWRSIDNSSLLVSDAVSFGVMAFEMWLITPSTTQNPISVDLKPQQYLIENLKFF